MFINDFIFDQNGVAKLKISHDNLITLGNNYIGFIKDDAIYDYNGTQRGWFDGGIVRDLQGFVVGFTNNPADRVIPLLPRITPPPRMNTPFPPPYKSFTQLKGLKPMKQRQWSVLDPLKIFGLDKNLIQVPTTIFDSIGRPRLRLLETYNFLTFKNTYVGFVKDDAIYDFNGTQRGWFENGIMRDLYGCVSGFTSDATDMPCPAFPHRLAIPSAPFNPFPPFRPFTGFKAIKPIKQKIWSQLDPIVMFGVGKA